MHDHPAFSLVVRGRKRLGIQTARARRTPHQNPDRLPVRRADACELLCESPRIDEKVQSHFLFFFFNDTATTEIYTLSLHDALPISCPRARCSSRAARFRASPSSM